MDFVAALNEKSTQWQSVDELPEFLNPSGKKLGYYIRSFIPFAGRCRDEINTMIENE